MEGIRERVWREKGDEATIENKLERRDNERKRKEIRK